MFVYSGSAKRDKNTKLFDYLYRLDCPTESDEETGKTIQN